MAQNEPVRRKSSSAEIPDKLYFRIGDVAKLCEVPAYVLRFWETEFQQLKPNKGGTGQRLYRRRDVEMALHIKRLLYDEGYTIPGARQHLKSEQRQTKEPQLALAIDPAGAVQAIDSLQVKKLERLRKELEELCVMLSRPAEAAAPKAVHTMRAARTPKAGTHLSITPAPAANASGPVRPAMDDLFDFQPSLLSFPDPARE